MLQSAIVTFTSILFIVDPLAAVPAYLVITQDESNSQRRRTALRACVGMAVILLGVLAGALAMTGSSAAIALDLIPDIAAGSLNEFIGYAGTILFSICSAISGWRLLTIRGPVVTITPQGIRDTRIAAEFIPWTSVKQISTWNCVGRKSWCYLWTPP